MLKIFDAEELWTCAYGHVPMTAAGFDDHWVPFYVSGILSFPHRFLSHSPIFWGFFIFYTFFFSPPFYPSKIIYFSVTVCSLMCGVFEDLASFKKYFVIECLLKRRRYLIAIAARKDFCSMSKIHPILMYNLRVFYTCRRSLVITCKQSVLLLVCRVLNVLINTKEKLGLQIDLCVFLNNDVFFNM